MKLSLTEKGRGDFPARLSHRPNQFNINDKVIHKAGARQLLA
jgi:hypothetical protein